MVRRVQDVVAQRAAGRFIGRDRELALLSRMLDAGEPFIMHVHGIAGIGKSSLLSAFQALARERGATVISLDCRVVEPTPEGFLRELGRATGLAAEQPRRAADRLSELGGQVVLTLDAYELFRLQDTWLRQEFIPQLPDNVRVALAGREPPIAAWWSMPGWQGFFESFVLEPLADLDALRILELGGFSTFEAARVNRIARGHPLALRLAASAARERPDLESAAMQRVVAELTRLYLLDIDDPLTRRALEASSVVRRATLPLLAAMLPDLAPQDAYHRLLALPFTELLGDGLHLHDAVQLAVVANLRAGDPERYHQYRRAAWQTLRMGVRSAAPSDLWRYTADMLYIIENPIIREGFFPTDSHRYAFEPARPEDDRAVRDIVVGAEGPESAEHLLRLWDAAPQVFRVAREPDGVVAGFYSLFKPGDVNPALLDADPIFRLWMRHLAEFPTPKGQLSLFCRRWLTAGRGELPSPVQGAAWLDIKRTYMELRPRLRRVYMPICDMETYGATAQQLGFQFVPGEQVVFDGRTYFSAVNDFGPNSIDGWLAGLVGIELGEPLEQDLLDHDARELVLNGQRVPLTKLEFGTLDYLQEQPGKAISREELLDAVWGHDYPGGSNVVDVIIRSLRKKLGDRATAIETVWGVGYRYRKQ